MVQSRKVGSLWTGNVGGSLCYCYLIEWSLDKRIQLSTLDHSELRSSWWQMLTWSHSFCDQVLGWHYSLAAKCSDSLFRSLVSWSEGCLVSLWSQFSLENAMILRYSPSPPAYFQSFEYHWSETSAFWPQHKGRDRYSKMEAWRQHWLREWLFSLKWQDWNSIMGRLAICPLTVSKTLTSISKPW